MRSPHGGGAREIDKARSKQNGIKSIIILFYEVKGWTYEVKLWYILENEGFKPPVFHMERLSPLSPSNSLISNQKEVILKFIFLFRNYLYLENEGFKPPIFHIRWGLRSPSFAVEHLSRWKNYGWNNKIFPKYSSLIKGEMKDLNLLSPIKWGGKGKITFPTYIVHGKPGRFQVSHTGFEPVSHGLEPCVLA